MSRGADRDRDGPIPQSAAPEEEGAPASYGREGSCAWCGELLKADEVFVCERCDEELSEGVGEP